MSSLLIIAAMEKELCPVPGARGLCSGVGPVEATLTTARSLAERPASVVLNVGIAGARGLPAGTLVVGSESIYCDVMDPNSTAPRVARLAPSSVLLGAARRALPHATFSPIATTAWVGGGQGLPVEAMEGFGVLRAAAATGVPALELRVISNDPAASDRRLWRIEDALTVLHRAIRTLAPALLDIARAPADALATPS